MRKTMVFYDDECPFCRAQMRILRTLDWRRRLTLRPLDDPETRHFLPASSPAELASAMHCLTADGGVFRGARAIRCFSLRVPMLVPLGLLLWIPGVLFLAEIVYQWVARHRQAFGRFCHFGASGEG